MTRRMADSVTVTNLPEGFDVYGGYTDGLYANMTALKARFPDKPLIGFTVFASDNFGDCLDVESGDATPDQAPGWIMARRLAGHPGPLVYCSEFLWSTVRAAFGAQNVPEPGYIIAAYPGSVGERGMYPPPAVGHQFKDWGPYDESVVVDYLPGIDPPPTPVFSEEENMPLYATNSGGTGFVIATDLSSKRGIPDATDAKNLLDTGLYKVVQLDDTLINAIPG